MLSCDPVLTADVAAVINELSSATPSERYRIARRPAHHEILDVYAADNHSAWDMASDGTYSRRRPVVGDDARPAQIVVVDRAGRD